MSFFIIQNLWNHIWKVGPATAVKSAPYLCSWILRVITWWRSCSISATVASGASVTLDRGTGFHLPTWIKPEQSVKLLLYNLPVLVFICSASVLRTFGLCGRVVRVAQGEQGHFYELVKQQIPLDQHKLCVFLWSVSLQLVLFVLHHTEHWQQVPWCRRDKGCNTTGNLNMCVSSSNQSYSESIWPLNLYPLQFITSAVPALALWPQCGGLLGQTGGFGDRTPLSAPLLGWRSCSILFQSGHLWRRGPGLYDWITALTFLGSITKGVHLRSRTNTEAKTLEIKYLSNI